MTMNKRLEKLLQFRKPKTRKWPLAVFVPAALVAGGAIGYALRKRVSLEND